MGDTMAGMRQLIAGLEEDVRLAQTRDQHMRASQRLLEARALLEAAESLLVPPPTRS